MYCIRLCASFAFLLSYKWPNFAVYYWYCGEADAVITVLRLEET